MKEVDIAVHRDYTKSGEEATATMILQMLTTATEVTFASKAVKQFYMLHAGEAMKMTMTHMKISMDSILVCYVCLIPIYHWVITAGTFLSIQGVTVQTVILPRKLQGSRVNIQLQSSSSVALNICEGDTCYQQGHA